MVLTQLSGIFEKFDKDEGFAFGYGHNDVQLYIGHDKNTGYRFVIYELYSVPYWLMTAFCFVYLVN